LSKIDDLARRLTRLERTTIAANSTPQLAHSSIEGGGSIGVYDVDGVNVARIGAQFDGTYGAVPLTGPTPPVPSAPIVEGGPVSLTVTWDGRYADLEARAPLDFHAVEVWVYDIPDMTRETSELVGAFPTEAGGTLTFSRPTGVWYVRLVAKSIPGLRSDMSEVGFGEATSVVDPATVAALDSALATAQDDLTDAAGRLDAAETTLNETFPQRFEAVESTATTALNNADAANSAAGLAAIDAATAANNASAAQSAADTAAANASDAVSAANAATAAAADAAGLAAGKANVLIQSTEPAVELRLPTTLWIDTTNGANTPKRWNNGWAAVTDKTAVDAAATAAAANTAAGNAASAAATAQSTADSAHSLAGDAVSNAQTALTAAGTAQSTADTAKTAAGTAQSAADAAKTAAGTAQTTADNRPKLLFGTGLPAGTAPQGSVWWQKDASNNIVGQWQQTAAGIASTWTSQPIKSEVIANLDVGKLSAGSAVIADAVIQKIVAQTASIQQADIKNLFVTQGATINSAVIDELFTQTFATKKLSAESVRIGTGANLIPNGAGEMGDATGWGDMTWDTTDKPTGLPGSFRSKASQSTLNLSSVATNQSMWFPVDPSTQYLFEVWVKADKANSRFYMELRDQDGTLQSAAAGGQTPSLASGNYVISNGLVPTVWTKYYAVVTTLATASKVRIAGLYFNHTNGTEKTATVWVAGARLKARLGGSLIVDGAIDGKTITGATIQTAVSGNRMVMNSGSLKGFNADGTEYLDLGAANGGTLTLTMQPGYEPDKKTSGMFGSGSLNLKHVGSGFEGTIGWTDYDPVYKTGGMLVFGRSAGKTMAWSDVIGYTVNGRNDLILHTSGKDANLSARSAEMQIRADSGYFGFWGDEFYVAAGKTSFITTNKDFTVSAGSGSISMVNTGTVNISTNNQVDLSSSEAAVRLNGATAYFGVPNSNLWPAFRSYSNGDWMLGAEIWGTYGRAAMKYTVSNNRMQMINAWQVNSTFYPQSDINFEGTRGAIRGRVNSRVEMNGGGVYDDLELQGGGALFLESGNGSGGVYGSRGGTRMRGIEDTTSGSYVISVGAARRLYQLSSTIKNKLAVETVPREDNYKILGLEPRMWQDRGAVERMVDYMDCLTEDTPGPDMTDTPDLRTIPGLIAEEVEAAGLGLFNTYDPTDGHLTGVQYDRIWILLIPVMRDLANRVATLEGKPAPYPNEAVNPFVEAMADHYTAHARETYEAKKALAQTNNA
jgi:hypothetical protein